MPKTQMAHETLTLDRETLQESFHLWQAEQESLDAEWSESLAALAAYQSHLDTWQQELSQEREELRREREKWEVELTQAEGKHDESAAQLADAREKLALLTEQLLTRTEELREIDQRRVDLTVELELARADVIRLATELEEQKRALEHERSTAAEQIGRLRELTERQAERAAAEPREVDGAAAVLNESAPIRKLVPRSAAKGGPAKGSANNPVLGSIVEQFGKLRQQRATDRQSGKKTG